MSTGSSSDNGVHYLTANEAGKHFGYTKDYMLLLIKQGKITGMKEGHKWYVHLSAAEEYFKQARIKREESLSQLREERKKELQSKMARPALPAPSRPFLASPYARMALLETFAIVLIGVCVGSMGYVGMSSRATVYESVSKPVDALALSTYDLFSNMAEDLVSSFKNVRQFASAISWIDQFNRNSVNDFARDLASRLAPRPPATIPATHSATTAVQYATTTIEHITHVTNTYPTSIIERHFTVTQGGVTASDLANVLEEAKAYTTKTVNKNMDAIDQPGVEDLFGSLSKGDLLIVSEDENGTTLSAGDEGAILQMQDGMPVWTGTSTMGFFDGGSIDTSAEIAALVTDETGTGALVFGTAPTLSDLTVLGNATTTGNVYIGGNLTIAGDSLVLGANIADTLVVNASVGSNLIPTVNATYDLGSPSYYWDDAYFDTITVNSISAASTSIAGTQSSTFTLNSDNASMDAEDMDLIFFRGTVVPNALLSWRSIPARFEFNQPLFIQNQSSNTTTVPALSLRGSTGQTGNLFEVASSTGTMYLTVSANGRLGIGTTTPSSTVTISGTDAIRIPVGTTAQRPLTAMVGQVRYNTTSAQFEGYGTSGAWQGLGGVVDIDQDTYITAEQNPDDDTLRFYTAGGERLTISSTGDVTLGTITAGTWNGSVIGDAYLTKTGNWTGTFDGQEGAYYLSRSNHTGTQTAATISDFTSAARLTLSESITGLEYNNATGIFSLTAGHTIPLSASTTAWTSFYDTPSSRITAGAGLSWTGNTLSCQTANGSTLGCLSAADWTAFMGKVSSSSVDTSAELAALVTDETGSGSLVFSNSPTFSGTVNAAALTLSSTLTLSGSAANIALGSNYLSGDGGDEGIYVDASGRVGIGTNAPTNALSFGNGSNQKIWIESSSSGTAGRSLGIEAGGVVAGAAEENFSALGQTSRTWQALAAAPNGDIYAAVYSGDIYKQTGGTGNFVALGQTSRAWHGMAVAPNGDVYAAVLSGDIYKQTGGTGNFVALGQTSRGWRSMAAAPNGDIYAVESNGDIYKQTGGSGNFMALGQTSRNWYAIAVAPNGDVYAADFGGDIYKQTGGSGSFVAQSAGNRNWTGLAISNGNVYAVANSGDIYKQTGGSGSFTGLGQSARNWQGMTASSNGNVYFAVWGGDIYRLQIVSGGANLAGGVLTLSSGAGSGSGSSTISFVTGTTLGSGTTLQTLSEKMVILGNGNVGIGTSSPSHLLTVNGSAYIAGLARIANLSVSGTSTLGYASSTSFTSAGNGYFGGNVGIGTTSPEVGLSISGSDSYGLLHLVNSAANGTASLSLRSADDANGAAGHWMLGKNLGGLSSDQFSIWQGTAGNRLTIDSSGRVGIGTTAPSTRLVVAGDGTGSVSIGNIYGSGNFAGISLNGLTGSGNYNFLSAASDPSLYINRPGGHSIQFRENNGTTQMILASGGNVGIGTTSPQEKLDVEGNLQLLGVSSGSAYLDFTRSSDNWTPARIGQSYQGSGYKGVLSFYTNGNGNGSLTERMTINGDGNVGIGTTTPDHILTILSPNLYSWTQGNSLALGASSNPLLQLRMGYDGVNDVAFIQSQNKNISAKNIALNPLGGSVGIGTTTPSQLLSLQSSIPVINLHATASGRTANVGMNDGYNLYINNPSGYTLINPSGSNVGIGITAPAARLHVHSSTDAFTQWTNSTTGSTGNDGLYIGQYSGSSVGYLVNRENAGLGLGTSGTTQLFIDSTGRVGIGTTTPGSKLTVAGDINFTGNLYQNGQPFSVAGAGIEWTSRTGTTTNAWTSVTYGNGLFVAVSTTGTGNRVMTSPDGINWTSRTSAADNQWQSVTYGNGMFVAVANSGTDRVMTSPDGINWTSRSTPISKNWNAVTYGNGLFVAVANWGPSHAVLTSPDGINWTARTIDSDLDWTSVTYGNGLFVAVSRDSDGIGNRVMTSPDGINWTSRTSAADNQWQSVTYGNGLFVAVAGSGTNNRVMTSPDGINWTIRTSAANNNWNSVTYGNGMFVAVSTGGTGNRVMTSPDGINWTIRSSAADNTWTSVTYGNGMFVAVGSVGVVMTSGKTSNNALAHNNIYQGGMSILGGNVGVGTTSPSSKFMVDGNALITGELTVGTSSVRIDTNSVRNLSGNLLLQPAGGTVLIGTSTVATSFASGPVGNPGVISNSSSIHVVTALSSTRVAYFDGSSKLLRAYDFDGTTWMPVGSGLSITSGGFFSVAALSATRVAFIDNTNDQLRTYEFNGSTWSQVGNSLSVTAFSDFNSLAALSATRVAFIDNTNDQLRTYDFDGTNWALVGSALSVSISGYTGLTPLSSSRIAFEHGGVLRTYEFNGSTWSQVGNTLSTGKGGRGAIAALSPTRVVLPSSAVPVELWTYDFDGTNWAQVGSPLSVEHHSVMSSPYEIAFTGLSSTRIAFIEFRAERDQSSVWTSQRWLRTYAIGVAAADYKLFVSGDVGASAFVNTSARDTKKDISYLDATSTTEMLSMISNMKIANYRYKTEADSAPLRLGLIADDVASVAPEILSANGQGVDVYQLATLTLGGVQALADEFDALENRLARLEVASSTSPMLGLAYIAEFAATSTDVEGNPVESLWERLKKLAQGFVDGVLTIAGLKADRIDVTQEICIDGVCITAENLRALLGMPEEEVEGEDDEETEEEEQIVDENGDGIPDNEQTEDAENGEDGEEGSESEVDVVAEGGDAQEVEDDAVGEGADEGIEEEPDDLGDETTDDAVGEEDSGGDTSGDSEGDDDAPAEGEGL